MFLAVSIIPVVIIGGIEGFKSTSLILIGIIIVVTLSISYIISYFISRPIEKLTKNIDQISKGKLDVDLEYSEIHEVNNLTDSLNRVMASLKLAIHKVGVKKAEIFEDTAKVKEAFEKQQQELFTKINGWAWETNDRGEYTFCSGNFKNLLGYNDSEIIGQSIYNFISDEDAKNVKQIFHKANKNKTEVKNLEIGFLNNKGEKIYILTNANPIVDNKGHFQGFRGVDIDITSEVVQRENIRKLKHELKLLKNEMSEILNGYKNKKTFSKDIPNIRIFEENDWTEKEFDSVFISDENANILDCNENLYKKLGYSKNEVLSLNLSDIDALESQDELKEKIKKVKKHGNLSFKTIHKRKDGSAILVKENIQYMKDKNQFKCIVREDN